MKLSIVKTTVGGAALLLAASLSFAAASQPERPPAAQRQAAASEPAVAGKKRPSAPRPVDINSASRAELMKLPGVNAADADRIVAGRPYLSKAHLVTRNVIPAAQYQGIRSQIMAVQPRGRATKAGAKG